MNATPADSSPLLAEVCSHLDRLLPRALELFERADFLDRVIFEISFAEVDDDTTVQRILLAPADDTQQDQLDEIPAARWLERQRWQSWCISKVANHGFDSPRLDQTVEIRRDRIDLRLTALEAQAFSVLLTMPVVGGVADHDHARLVIDETPEIPLSAHERLALGHRDDIVRRRITEVLQGVFDWHPRATRAMLADLGRITEVLNEGRLIVFDPRRPVPDHTDENDL